MSRRPRHSHIYAKQKHGHYPEPAWCSQRLFDVEDFGPPGTLILDPACGWGTILQAAQAARFRVMGFDIVDRVQRDKLNGGRFYQFDYINGGGIPTKSHVMSIVCNPPFDHVQEYIERSMQIADYKVAMICLVRRLNAARWLRDWPLETVYLLTPRPSMPPGEHIMRGHKPTGGTQDFCWLVFNNQMSRLKSPRVKWLTREVDT